jgi:hypothetical protein
MPSIIYQVKKELENNAASPNGRLAISSRIYAPLLSGTKLYLVERLSPPFKAERVIGRREFAPYLHPALEQCKIFLPGVLP